ncbi:hypothetical protein SPRG_12975 [Saprolegnia parasitica CBS 223.65]|uniref:N-acetyltransferase domain-containing protein n=1 Tax=Saprolegnia parasitica (strain CBS 223.65) TaxID=695850 RepID=A0A067BQT5_SAPPC|nr:hypothetical protein SPRG_12975 [Saprolegnia parasitica CBS 223.65]KDO20618.1 hypothetical protein SPRG_12975 [Saprolegnia parasitica CBS 223.65]|eukprot:XP_012208673.1 hypothetical protein SPRG_12975 [Saprolegnia parasitica CBS 223.65]
MVYVRQLDSAPEYLAATHLLRISLLEATNHMSCIACTDPSAAWFVLADSANCPVSAYAVLSQARGVLLSPFMTPNEASALATYFRTLSLPMPGTVRGLSESVAGFAANMPHDITREAWLYRLHRVKLPANAVAGTLIVATDTHAAQLRAWYKLFKRECFDESLDDVAASTLVQRGLWRKALYVWIADGVVVGFGGVAPPMTTDAMTVYMLGPIFIAPHARGHGFSKGLTAAISATLLDTCPTPQASITLYADVKNLAANAAYKAVGFLPIERDVTCALRREP